MGILKLKESEIWLRAQKNTKETMLTLYPCDNPHCACGNVVIFHEKSSFELNVHDKTFRIFTGISDALYDEKESIILKEHFENELSNDDWIILHEYDNLIKQSECEYSTTETPHIFDIPQNHLSDPSLMISFQQVFPASEILTFSKDGIEYEVIDQHCKNTDCKCTSTNLHIFEDNKVIFDFFYDYKTQDCSDYSEKGYEWVKSELINQIEDFSQRLYMRNARIRLAIYKRLDEINKENKKMLPNLQRKKIGRNEKCPCGSGKKYKKCCLSSGIYS